MNGNASAIGTAGLNLPMPPAAVAVELDAPEPFELDGDGFGEVIRLGIAVDPQGLRVRVPR